MSDLLELVNDRLCLKERGILGYGIVLVDFYGFLTKGYIDPVYDMVDALIERGDTKLIGHVRNLFLIPESNTGPLLAVETRLKARGGAMVVYGSHEPSVYRPLNWASSEQEAIALIKQYSDLKGH